MENNRKYRPSNGSEGMWFTEKYCMNCIHCDPDPDGPKQCEILCDTMCFNVNEPEYPGEWTYDENDKPKCTKWVKWDWGNDGNPDDPDNPKFIPPTDPNQLVLPFMIEEINLNTLERKEEKVLINILLNITDRAWRRSGLISLKH